MQGGLLTGGVGWGVIVMMLVKGSELFRPHSNASTARQTKEAVVCEYEKAGARPDVLLSGRDNPDRSLVMMRFPSPSNQRTAKPFAGASL